MLDNASFLIPDWSAPATVRAYSTTRQGGYSLLFWGGFNMADYVGDEPGHVAMN